MTTDPTITDSLAAACAAHDRHRLDVLDALLDEAAPAAVRELLGVALDLCASLRAERDELRAVSNALSDESFKRDAQLAAARQVIDEERAAGWETVKAENQRAINAEARVASLESERTEWIAAAVAVGDALGGSLGPVTGTSGTIDPREWIRYAQGLARDVRKLTARVAELEATDRAIKITPTLLAAAMVGSRDGSVTPYAAAHAEHLLKLAGELVITLPAQDRAEELIRSILSERKAMMSGIGASLDDKLSNTWASEWINATRSSLASLGTPVSTPTAAPDRSLALAAASLLRDIVRNEGLAHGGEVGPRASDCMDMVRRMESTPTAAPGLVAAVSVEDLACAWFNACEPGGTVPDDIDDFDRARVRAVLARLNATTIAPVDPEAVARAYHDDNSGPSDLTVPYWRGLSLNARAAAKNAMRATLTAHGIPVTPEVGK